MLIISQVKIKESQISDIKSLKETLHYADKMVVDTTEFGHDMRRLLTSKGNQELKKCK